MPLTAGARLGWYEITARIGSGGMGGARAVDSLYRHWGKVPPVDRISADEMSRYFWYLDASKAERELGFRSRDTGDTLYETVTYLREHFLGHEAFRAGVS